MGPDSDFGPFPLRAQAAFAFALLLDFAFAAPTVRGWGRLLGCALLLPQRYEVVLYCLYKMYLRYSSCAILG